MSSPALSFGSAARLYDSIRPTYPVQAVTWAIGAEPVRVLDLGAGTGLLTGALRAVGHEVIAVEPDEQARVDLEIGELAATDPALAGRDSVEMPYRTCVYRMRRV
ncbi:methyltransferase domain-containing protein [Peterkaempfera griseoplana]|uniref:class I SAM-dependent methyltransferase n=1 Tax=Peterkaempfera griseoplana TaxID=66896 RepID=UPI0006E20E25|nr:class I SAM-dependent methyltransferase [Peterkaempfera griseoplana]